MCYPFFYHQITKLAGGHSIMTHQFLRNLWKAYDFCLSQVVFLFCVSLNWGRHVRERRLEMNNSHDFFTDFFKIGGSKQNWKKVEGEYSPEKRMVCLRQASYMIGSSNREKKGEKIKKREEKVI